MNARHTKPNFFIVGAPKCGTTSLYEYLRQHPDVFMPYSSESFWLHKEPFYFCPELIARYTMRVQTEASYLDLFSSAGNARRIGEASALYLYSPDAAGRIKEFQPDAKIIVILRNPVDFILSWHRDNLRWGHEDVAELPKALALEPERLEGRRLPKGSGYPQCTRYVNMATFARQVERYFNVFGRDSVRVWLLDDLAREPEKTFRQTAQHLEIDDSFVPAFDIHNEKQAITQARLIENRVKNWLRLHVRGLRHIRPLIPSRLATSCRRLAESLAKPAISSLDEAHRAELRKSLRPSIDELSRLLQRDLSSWT